MLVEILRLDPRLRELVSGLLHVLWNTKPVFPIT